MTAPRAEAPASVASPISSISVFEASAIGPPSRVPARIALSVSSRAAYSAAAGARASAGGKMTDPGHFRTIGSLVGAFGAGYRSEEHTSELQSRLHLVCRLLLEKKKTHH